MTGRFQYYQEAYLLETELFGIRGKVVDVRRITEPPINYIYIEGDTVCPVEK